MYSCLICSKESDYDSSFRVFSVKEDKKYMFCSPVCYCATVHDCSIGDLYRTIAMPFYHRQKTLVTLDEFTQQTKSIYTYHNSSSSLSKNLKSSNSKSSSSKREEEYVLIDTCSFQD